MNASRNKPCAGCASFAIANHQRGIATILILLLVGLSLTAAVLGAMHYTRSAQDQLMSVHSQTQAQMRAWTGAETVRAFLVQAKKNGQLKALATKVAAASSTPIGIDGLPDVSAEFTAVDDAANPTKITAVITGTGAGSSKAESSSTIEVVYDLTAPAPEYAKQNDATAVSYNKGVKFGGGITVEHDPDKEFIISVNGDVTTDGNSITGVSTIRSTGSISIGSGSSFGKLEANCDVRLTGSVTADTINARRNVCLTGGAAGKTAINANGSVSVENTNNGDIAAIGNPTDVASCSPPGTSESGNTAGTCDAPDPLYAVKMSEASATSVKAKKGVSLKGKQIGDLQAEGNLSIGEGAYVDGGVITGLIVDKPANYDVIGRIKITENSAGLTVSIPQVSRVTMNSYIIDAYDYLPVANYVFKIDANGNKKVTVSNVSGIADGEYYLGRYEISWWPKDVFAEQGAKDYLCKTLESPNPTGDPVCLKSAYGSDTAPKSRIGMGNGEPGKYIDGSLFGYDASTKTWTLNGQSMAQGVAWFEGDLSVGSGTFYNTFIASRNITNSGSTVVYAPNYAGYDGTDKGKRYAPTGMCENSNFPSLYPKQFCNKDKKTYLADALGGLGNFTMVAGSVKGGTYTDASSYDGGNIATGASCTLYGSVKAGNEFTSGGGTVIYGYVSAMAAGQSVNNSVGGSTTLKLKTEDLPSTFTPGGGGGSTTTCIAHCGTDSYVAIQWSRYR